MCNCGARQREREIEWKRGRWVREAQGGRDRRKHDEDSLYLTNSLGWLEWWTGTGALQVRWDWKLEAAVESLCVCVFLGGHVLAGIRVHTCCACCGCIDGVHMLTKQATRGLMYKLFTASFVSLFEWAVICWLMCAFLREREGEAAVMFRHNTGLEEDRGRKSKKGWFEGGGGAERMTTWERDRGGGGVERVQPVLHAGQVMQRSTLRD